MSHGLSELTGRAQHFAAAGDLSAAHHLLGEALATADPDPTRASVALADAAGLQARVLIALGEPQGARSWAAFAHAAHRRLHGDADARTVVATATLAATLHRLGDNARATTLYRDVVNHLTDLEGPDSARVLAAQADLATVEHARGDCLAAQARLADAHQRHEQVHGEADQAGIKMLARLGAMHRDCGHFAEAHQHFGRARELCAAYLGADHPMAGQIAALARAPADPVHVCRPAGAAPAPADIPAPEEHDGQAPAYDGDEGLEPWWPADPVVTAPLPPPVLADLQAAQQDQAPRRSADAANPGAVQVRPAGGHLPVPLYRPPSRRSRHPIVLVAAGTAVVAMGTAAAALALAMTADDPGPGAPRASAAGAAAAPPAPPASTAPGVPASAGPTPKGSAAPTGAPPSAVSLRDSRDSVTLSWTYPRGSEGPVVIAGARAGQELRAFQELPAGSDTYVVYALNEDADYCFRISVVYAANRVATAPPVCTSRKGQ